jgi:hypothetical protein
MGSHSHMPFRESSDHVVWRTSLLQLSFLALTAYIIVTSFWPVFNSLDFFCFLFLYFTFLLTTVRVRLFKIYEWTITVSKASEGDLRFVIIICNVTILTIKRECIIDMVLKKFLNKNWEFHNCTSVSVRTVVHQQKVNMLKTFNSKN